MERRYELQRKLEEVLGREAASTIMEHLPPDKWDQLARRDDVAALRRDVDALKADVEALKADVAALQHEVRSLRSWLEQAFAIVEERREATEHRILGAIRSEMAGLVSTQTRTIVIALVAAITANSGMVLAAVRFA